MKKFNCAEIEKIIGYEFKNKALLRQAFTRESYCNELRAYSDEWAYIVDNYMMSLYV